MKVDETRWARKIDDNVTGIFARATYKGKWLSVDIYYLEKDSLYEFIKGGANPWGDDIIGILLNHGHFKKGNYV